MEVLVRGVLMRDGRILLCRNVGRGYYYLPGGHVEQGETAAEALQREFREETGLGVVVWRGVAMAECRFVQDGVRRSEVNLVFHVELSTPPASSPADTIESLEPEIAFEWIAPGRLPALDMRPAVLRDWLHSLKAPFDPEIAPVWLASDQLGALSD